MSNNHIKEPDDEREVSSSSKLNLDRLLYERHFRNNPIQQIDDNDLNQTNILLTSSDNIPVNNIITTPTNQPPPNILPHSKHIEQSTFDYKNSLRPINICNVNIQGFNDPTKRFQFLDHCTRQNLDIIGLSELHFSNKSNTRNEIFTKNDTYDFYWSIDDTDKLTAGGVGLAIHKQLSKHVRSWQEYKGRIVYADLYFKQKNKIRIVQLYNPPRKHHILSMDIFRKLENVIIDALKNNFQLMIMGDFNEDMNKFHSRKREGQSTKSYKFNYLRLMNKYNLSNAHELFHNAPFENTWNDKSRI